MADGPQSIYAPLSNGDTKKVSFSLPLPILVRGPCLPRLQSAAEPQRHAPSPLVPRPKRALGLAALAFSAIYWILSQPYVSEDGASLLRGYCANVPSITSHEFGTRQTWLGETLQALGGGSFLAEPGASAGYFANLSGTHWHLSERPLLLLVSPSEDGKDAQVTVLTPFFEATRAKMLPIAAKHISWVEWPEDADPYTTLLASLPVLARGRPVYIDRNARHFVATGLAHAGADVQPAPVAVRALRERKSAAELALMRCANEATLLAIRHVRGKMSLGVRESQVRAWITEALAEAGLTSTWSVILFGDNAALPHGTGSDRTLGKQDLALIDAGGNLRGYSSDVTRVCSIVRPNTL
jgi:Xaa-Pro aminopeptidase